MLTQEIKQKIDSARDILVGKIPTPTGQVEQITLALVYKFMNDIDEQNVELGGSHKFFTGEYQKYAWKHLLDKSISAYERVTLYGEGLDKMHLNPNLPQFFRNVFKGAFLPFRDPEVLTLFLKQIDGFKYGHNGDLGDAFEYLLQVMGTQGDAGQFLTPRHIINFIVSIVDPQKTDQILDPAVGTAGFLISAYQHILRQNTKEGSNKPGSALTIDERKRFAHNFVGYDVSHDLVRLSLVNLYLHEFSDPRIHEYDTLGNLDKWDDDFDCILTNPPFMTPKGGVKPHKRFSIQAKRSEVLFVDYIMEHLNPNGKAGIIVPEGIIFQSANAYKALRKMMIDQNFLFAVVSLPAGIFQPYSGVKTSILFMDRVIAKKTKDILFVKVENDGFDLGAQRRPIDKNDLPTAAEILKRYKMSIQTREPYELSEEDKQIANLVPVDKISKSGDYNLAGDRYKADLRIGSTTFSIVNLQSVAYFQEGPGILSSQYENNGYPMVNVKNVRDGYLDLTDTKYVSNEIAHGKWKHFQVNEHDILFTTSGTIGRVARVKNIDLPLLLNTSVVRFRTLDEKQLTQKYLYYILKSDTFVNTLLKHKTGSAQFNVGPTHLKLMQIPLPPLEVQQEIVSQLGSYQKIIDGAKQVVDNYKPEIKIDPTWEMVELGEVCIFEYGKPLKEENRKGGEYPVFGSNGIVGYHDEYLVEGPFIIVGRKGTAGAVVYSEKSGYPIDTAFYVKLKNAGNTDTKFLYYILGTLGLDQINTQAGVPGLNRNDAYKTQIPLPPLDIQKQIVSRIEDEQQLVNVNKKLIQVYQGKIREKIDEVWGENVT